MTTPTVASVLDGARVVQHDSIGAESLAFVGGLVSSAQPEAFHVDLRDHLILPGLVNAHDHLQLNSVPRLAHDEPFPNSYEWIKAVSLHRQHPEVIAATDVPSAVRHRHGGLKNVLAGVTTVAHHDPWHVTFDESDFPVGVLREFGWSHSLRLGESGEGEAGSGKDGTRYGPPLQASFCATPRDHPWIIHLAEGADDVARAELAELDSLGCLAANTVIVHGVGLTRANVDRVIDCCAAVVWCPASNLGMFGRTLDPARLAAAGRLALGTDSRLTGSRDLLDELRVAATHSGLSAADLLRLVTESASRILRRDDIGGLHPGQQADCFVVRAGDEPHEVLLQTQRGAIRAVVRGGAPMIADPDFADWFDHCGISAVAVRLDGQPKLLARRLARTEVVALEPGLEFV